MTKTRSELLFESFCVVNGLPWTRVEEGSTPTPDYLVHMRSGQVYFEIKQIDEDAEFRRPGGVSSRIVGDTDERLEVPDETLPYRHHRR